MWVAYFLKQNGYSCLIFLKNEIKSGGQWCKFLDITMFTAFSQFMICTEMSALFGRKVDGLLGFKQLGRGVMHYVREKFGEVWNLENYSLREISKRRRSVPVYNGKLLIDEQLEYQLY